MDFSYIRIGGGFARTRGGLMAELLLTEALERFHKTLKIEHVRRSAYTRYDDAKIRMAL
jgi:hypothetical protein